MKKHLVILTGAGISAESGIKTFRDSGGLWEEHDVMDVASYDGWLKNKELVLRFYNDRRKQLAEALPNVAHKGLAELEKIYNVTIITQNVDNLHEQAGSTDILHLHGELTKARSTTDDKYIVDIGFNEINLGDKCPKGGQMRPHIVWFGEAVPAMNNAVAITDKADIFVVIGTSLNVYPAAGLLNYVPRKCPIYLIDPNDLNIQISRKFTFIKENASTGVQKLKEYLIQ